MGGLLVTTTEKVPGYRVVEVKGLARGGIVRATHVGRDIMAFLKNLKGGEVKEYTEMLAEAREEALKRMVLNAQEMGGERRYRSPLHDLVGRLGHGRDIRLRNGGGR